MSKGMGKESKTEKVKKLIDKMILEEDYEKRSEIADSILEVDPNNPLAKYIKWQEMDYEESLEKMDLLFDAIDFLRPVVKSHDENVGEEAYSIYLSMLSDLSSFLYFKGEKERAFEVSQEFMDLDNECYIAGRIVYYSILVERGEYKKVIDDAEADICETPMSEYSRAIAIFELDGPTEDALDAAIRAISLDPDMAFYVAGLWTFDDEEIDSLEEEEEEEMDELMMQSVVLSDLWTFTDDRLAFLSSIVFAFGYLTGRTEEPDDIHMLEDSYRSLGCLEEMRDARDAVHAMIADGKEQSEIDEEALLLFRDIKDRGLSC